MTRNNRWLREPLFIAGLFAVFAGCRSYHYEIELIPDQDAIQRQLTCWFADNAKDDEWTILNFPADTLSKIASAYGATPDEKRDKKHTFRSRFTGKMPVDLENSGTYTRWTSPFGAAYLYLERFGGNDDIAGQIDARRKACSRLIAQSIGWLESELGKEAKWNDVRQWLDVDVRRDLENISFTILASGPDSAESVSDQHVFAGRLLQYLVERGYLEPRELAKFSSGDADPFLETVDRLVGRRLGLADDAPRPMAMAFLRDENSATASLDRYLRETPEFQALMNEWNKLKKDSPDAREPEPIDVVASLVESSFVELNLFGDATKLDIVLVTGVKPFATNGAWEEDGQKIRWKGTMNGKQGLPTIFQAYWCEPNSAEQEMHFGWLALAEEELFNYVLWYNSLGKNDRDEWNAFIAALRPGADLVSKLTSFRFSSDPPLAPNLTLIPAGPMPGRAFQTLSTILANQAKREPTTSP